MKVRPVAALAGCSMMLSSVSVWSLTDPARKVGVSETSVDRPDDRSSDRVDSVFSTGGVVRLEGPVEIEVVAGFVLPLVAGMILLYCLWLMFSACGFWVVRLDVLLDLFMGL